MGKHPPGVPGTPPWDPWDPPWEPWDPPMGTLGPPPWEPWDPPWDPRVGLWGPMGPWTRASGDPWARGPIGQGPGPLGTRGLGDPGPLGTRGPWGPRDKKRSAESPDSQSILSKDVYVKNICLYK